MQKGPEVPDPIRLLLDRQLETWRGDSHLSAGHLYLISRNNSMDVEVSRVGDSPPLSESEVKNLLGRAAGDERPGFEVRLGTRLAYVYPLKSEGVLQGMWLMFPAPGAVDWASWTRESQQFSDQLFLLGQTGMAHPPTFRQLVQAIPEFEESVEFSGQENAPPLHWERSKSRVDVPIEDELGGQLMVDHLPIF